MNILCKVWLPAAMLLGCSLVVNDAILDARPDVIQPRFLDTGEVKTIIKSCPEIENLRGDIFKIHLDSHDLIGSSESCRVGSNGRICEIIVVSSAANQCAGKYFLSPSVIRADQETINFGQETWHRQPGYKSISNDVLSLVGSGRVYLGLSNDSAALLIDRDDRLIVWNYIEE